MLPRGADCKGNSVVGEMELINQAPESLKGLNSRKERK